MAPQTVVNERVAFSLRSLTYRLTSTPVQHLPQISPHLAAQLVSCAHLLSAPQDAISKDNAALVHALKTRLSSLLQDRSVEGRWAAVVLIKSTVELGGSEVLYGDRERVAGWIRGLIGILNKPDPSTTKQLCIITLTRIFMLTRDYPTLTRELTTPSLPPYVTACLNHFQTKDSGHTAAQRALIGPVLESFSHLVPRHPTIFRTSLPQIRRVALQVLSSDIFRSDNAYVAPRQVLDVAQRLLVQLHQCAQKGGSTEEWDAAVKKLVTSIHATADQVFRAVAEDWESVAGVQSTTAAGQTLSDQPGESARDGFAAWTGMKSGTERITSLLGLLKSYISTVSSASIPLRLGIIVDLLTRLLYMQVPRGKDSDRLGAGSRFNNQVSRQEREELWNVLPSIHVASLEVFVALIQRLEIASIPASLQLLDLLPWLFEAERSDHSLRVAVYESLNIVLPLIGPSLSKQLVSSLETIIKACCRDLLPITKPTSHDTSSNGAQNGTSSSAKTNASTEAMLNATKGSISSPTNFERLKEAAFTLLPVLLSHLPAEHVPIPIRTELDRVAILTKHQDALTASVLNPSPQKPSLLPLMASLTPASLITEGILKPRMPVIRTIVREGDTPGIDLDEPNSMNDETMHDHVPVMAANGDDPTVFDIFSKKPPNPTKRNQDDESISAEPSKRARLDPASTFADLDKPMGAAINVPVPTSQATAASAAPITLANPTRVEVAEQGVGSHPMQGESSTTYMGSGNAEEIKQDLNDAAPINDGDNDDDDDDDDFEIPSLVMRGDSDPEDEDEEYEEEEEEEEEG